MLDFDALYSRFSVFSKYITDKAAEKWKTQQLMRENKLLLGLYQIYTYLVFLPLLAVSTTILGIIATLLAILVDKKIASVCGIIWARFNSYITPMLVTVIGKEKIQKDKSYVIVANHQSQYDIFVIYGWMPVDFRWVMKMQLRGVPFLGYACYKIGHIFIDRSHPDAAKASINAARDRIKGGTSIMFFPEGTRSEDGRLKEFKKGAFKFALDMGLPILPVTIINTRNVLPAKSLKLFPGKAKMVIHDPIDISGYGEESMGKIMDLAKKSIQQGLDQHS
ncbi:MAG TPA: lysophospholipid acyltransferase family protein [Smithellaceae bacterium]|nr:lysophospholipid acyltransferase family protein [Smithellaceae bacterium]HRS88483.1 lysophospholipid acyltransferase family protein [Smithellaceae bacterium]HRV25539.1 lysophospholipid acyltransferase family protein [Smithellaceae bacterium]